MFDGMLEVIVSATAVVLACGQLVAACRSALRAVLAFQKKLALACSKKWADFVSTNAGGVSAQFMVA